MHRVGPESAFAGAMASMAVDPAVRNECAAIADEFACADMDGFR
jgi:hypothetical protein